MITITNETGYLKAVKDTGETLLFPNGTGTVTAFNQNQFQIRSSAGTPLIVDVSQGVKIEGVTYTTVATAIAALGFFLTKPSSLLLDSDLMFSLTEPQEDDVRFPLIGSRFDTLLGQIDYDLFNGILKVQSGARYPNHPIIIQAQLPHSIVFDKIYPHIHWKQRSENKINWVLGHKIDKKGDLTNIETDYSNYTFSAIDANVYEYESGILEQYSFFDAIDISDLSKSDQITFALFRDSTNNLGLYGGADTAEGDAYLTEFDYHAQFNSLGTTPVIY